MAYSGGQMEAKAPKPDDIPSNPAGVYAHKGWQGWGDWLGTGTVAVFNREFRSFREAREFARALRLNSSSDWKKYCRGEMTDKPMRPADIPSNPNLTYRGSGWTGYGDWLGSGAVAPFDRRFRSFEQARIFARSLGLSSQTEWNIYRKDGLPGKPALPADVPKNPYRTYKDRGWFSWPDWLGTGQAQSGSANGKEHSQS